MASVVLVILELLQQAGKQRWGPGSQWASSPGVCINTGTELAVNLCVSETDPASLMLLSPLMTFKMKLKSVTYTVFQFSRLFLRQGFFMHPIWPGTGGKAPASAFLVLG